MTPVPDGARGNHFRNKKQDTICIEIKSAVPSPSPHVSMVVWLNGLLMIPLYYMDGKYATMTSPCPNDAQLATSLTQSPSFFVWEMLQHCLIVRNAVRSIRQATYICLVYQLVSCSFPSRLFLLLWENYCNCFVAGSSVVHISTFHLSGIGEIHSASLFIPVFRSICLRGEQCFH